MNNTFQENQKFSSWILWIILIGTTGFMLYGLYQQLFLGEPFGDNPSSDTELILVCLLMAALILFFALLRLKTNIDQKEIRIHYFPVLKKSFKWADIESAQVVKHNVFGWGFRYSFKYGTVYNVKGNEGLSIELKSGKKYLIGTQKTDELKTFLTKIAVN